ncbi:hypothetical protein ACHAXR_010196 [Thalassiosira sp. AJA248-18]
MQQETVLNDNVVLDGDEQQQQPPQETTQDEEEEQEEESWIEATDPSSGNIYYYNRDTGETSWTKPEMAAPEMAAASPSEEEPTMVPLSPQQSPPLLGAEEENVVDDELHGQPASSGEVVDIAKENDIVELLSTTDGVDHHHDGPPSPPIEAASSQDDVDTATNNNAVVGSPSSNGPPPPTQQQHQPDSENSDEAFDNEGWTQVDHPATTTTNTTLLLSEEEDTIVDQQQPPKAEENDDKGTDDGQLPLPEGWIESMDPTTGNIYYYNEVTGVSSWERPVVENDKKGLVNDEEDEPSSSGDLDLLQVNNEEEVIEKDDGGGTAADDSKPPDEPTSPGSFEETESLPAAAAPQEGRAAAAKPSDAADTTTAATNNIIEPLPPLPKGWAETTDPTSRKVYYYHEESNECVWDRPSTAAADAAEVAVVVDETTEVAVAIGVGDDQEPTTANGDDSDELLKQGEPDHDDDDGVIVVEGDSSKPAGDDDDALVLDGSGGGMHQQQQPLQQEEIMADDASQAVVQKEPTEDAAAPTASTTSSADEDVQQPLLPEGWAEATDPSTNTIYYYNETTGATSWDCPTTTAQNKVAAVEAGGGTEEGTVVGKQETEEEEGATPDDAAAVVEESSLTVSSAAVPATEEDLNELIMPNDTCAAAASSITSADNDVQDASTVIQEETTLADGWIEATDPNSGQMYYYNEATGATSWDRPTVDGGNNDVVLPGKEEDDVEEVSKEEVGVPGVKSAGNSDAAADVVAEEAVAAAATKSKGGPEQPESASSLDNVITSSPSSFDDDSTSIILPLPEGWVETTDPNSGAEYYYNEITGDTTWDRPRQQKDKEPITEPVVVAGSLSKQPTVVGEEEMSTLTASAQQQKKEQRPRPAHAIATFGFGGRFCVMIPQVAASLSGAVPQQPQPFSTGGERPTTLRRGPVVIHRVKDLIPKNHKCSIPSPSSTTTVTNNNESSTTHSHPLINLHDTQVLSYLSNKSSNLDNLLWNVIHIAALNRGRLRNDKVAKKAIVELLLADTNGKMEEEECKTSNGGTKIRRDSSTPPTSSSSNSNSSEDLAEVQQLILRGERESAVSEALTTQNYALALIIASMCDRTTYQIAARRFADEALVCGTPLHTATLLFSNNLELPRDEELLNPYNDADAYGGKNNGCNTFWYDEMYDGLEESWREQLASILSNQTSGWERIVLTLGDRLLNLGNTSAAHVCYLVSTCPFASPSKPTTRLVLLGCDHRRSMNTRLMTPSSIEAFERTEAFEWARRRCGNKKTHIPTLQPFKLRYAELLADFGREELAREYLLSIRSCIGLDDDGDVNKGGGVSAGTASGNFPSALLHHGSDFIESLKQLDDRICVSTGAERSSWDSAKNNKDGTKGTAATAVLGSIVKSVLGKKSKVLLPLSEAVVPPQHHPSSNDGGANPETIFQQQLLQEPCKSPSQVGSMPPQQQQQQQQPTVEQPSTKTHAITADAAESIPKGGGANNSFISAKPSFEQPTAAAEEEVSKSPMLLSNPFSHDKDNFSITGKSNRDEHGPPSSAPPTFGLDDMTNKIDEEPHKQKEEKEAILLSTPKPASKKDDKKKAPVSEPVGAAPRSGGGGWFSKLLRRRADDESKATVADVGEEMQAYYDEKLKRWIFPGDDPAEVAKPLAPPPMNIPKPKTTGEAAPATPAAASIDPLAALMAPPTRLSSKKKGTPMMTSRYADPLASTGSSSKVPPSPMMNQAPPTFAVFQPAPASTNAALSKDEE